LRPSTRNYEGEAFSDPNGATFCRAAHIAVPMSRNVLGTCVPAQTAMRARVTLVTTDYHAAEDFLDGDANTLVTLKLP
jgi:hypothetical protein